MTALYIGALWQGGTCLERTKVLGGRGWAIVQFDIVPPRLEMEASFSR